MQNEMLREIGKILKSPYSDPQNMSIFVGHSLNEFFNIVPKEKYFILHLDLNKELFL